MISQHKKKVNKIETIQNRKARCEKCGQSFTRPLGFGGKVRPTQDVQAMFQTRHKLYKGMVPAWASI